MNKRSVYYRYWNKVDRKGANECWNWKGTKHNRGYGLIKVGGKTSIRKIGRAHV